MCECGQRREGSHGCRDSAVCPVATGTRVGEAALETRSRGSGGVSVKTNERKAKPALDFNHLRDKARASQRRDYNRASTSSAASSASTLPPHSPFPPVICKDPHAGEVGYISARTYLRARPPWTPSPTHSLCNPFNPSIFLPFSNKDCYSTTIQGPCGFF